MTEKTIDVGALVHASAGIQYFQELVGDGPGCFLVAAVGGEEVSGKAFDCLGIQEFRTELERFGVE